MADSRGRYNAPVMPVGMMTNVTVPAAVVSSVLHAIPHRSANDRALRSAHERTGNRADDRSLGTALRAYPFTLPITEEAGSARATVSAAACNFRVSTDVIS